MTHANEDGTGRVNPFARVGRYAGQTLDELRKTVTPTTREWAGWTVASMLFVLALIAMVSAMDIRLGRLVLAVFG